MLCSCTLLANKYKASWSLRRENYGVWPIVTYFAGVNMSTLAVYAHRAEVSVKAQHLLCQRTEILIAGEDELGAVLPGDEAVK